MTDTARTFLAANGDRLCAALMKAFPKLKFTTTTILGSSSEEAVFVPHGIGTKRITRSAAEWGEPGGKESWFKSWDEKWPG